MKEAPQNAADIERYLAAVSHADASEKGIQSSSALDPQKAPVGKVAVIGSMNADYTVEVEEMPQPGETIKGGPLAVHPGGKSANQAASCARLGQDTRMLGAVGSDTNADFLVDNLAHAGANTDGIERVGGPSGSTVIVVDANGENFVVVSAGSNGEVTPEYARRHADVIRDSAVLGLCLETPMDTVLEAATIAAAAGTTVVLNISPLPEAVPKDLLEASDIVIMNEHETTDFLGLGKVLSLDSDWTQVHAQMSARGIPRAVITMGGAGSVVLDGSDSEPVHISAYTVKPVDTTGAGDSFMGATLAGLASGLSLVEACSLASAVSAYSTMGKGAQSSYGNAEDISRFVSAR